MERIFLERNDFTILHEPFSTLYYVHEAKGSAQYEAVVNEECSYESIKNQILAAAEIGPVFFKDMAYHPFQHIMSDDAFLARMTNTFIIRDPADTINSHFAMNPDLTQEEVGYERQLLLFNRLEQMQRRPPTLVDSDELAKNPAQVIEAYCQEVGIIHVPEALEWEPGQPELWKGWESWHKDASESHGITAKKNSYAIRVDNDEHLRRMCEIETPFYNALREHCIRVASPPNTN